MLQKANKIHGLTKDRDHSPLEKVLLDIGYIN